MSDRPTEDLEARLRQAKREAFNAERRVLNAELAVKRFQRTAKLKQDAVTRLEEQTAQRTEVTGL